MNRRKDINLEQVQAKILDLASECFDSSENEYRLTEESLSALVRLSFNLGVDDLASKTVLSLQDISTHTAQMREDYHIDNYVNILKGKYENEDK